MKTRKLELETNKELTRQLIIAEREKLLNMIETVIHSRILDKTGAVLTRKEIQLDFKDNIEIMFDLGFYNADEDRIDFGSDLWCCYSFAKNELSFNYGTIGTFTKSNKYQVMRVNLIYQMFSIVELLEQEFYYICTMASEWKKHEQDLIHIDCELINIQAEEKKLEAEKIASKFVVGTRLKYNDGVRRNTVLFYEHDGAWFRIVKETPKYVFVTATSDDDVTKVHKEKLLNHVMAGVITMRGADE